MHVAVLAILLSFAVLPETDNDADGRVQSPSPEQLCLPISIREKLNELSDPYERRILLLDEARKRPDEARKYIGRHRVRPLPGDENLARIRVQQALLGLLRETDCFLSVCASENQLKVLSQEQRKKMSGSLQKLLGDLKALRRASVVSTNEKLESLTKSSIHLSQQILASL